mmetsp:Transcript_7129/g.9308  ORF Transcript_7129/g.9308 Transcript_7129/m.9308 type:complete len:543 (-) Transcript_7129:27-1655(-)
MPPKRKTQSKTYYVESSSENDEDLMDLTMDDSDFDADEDFSPPAKKKGKKPQQKKRETIPSPRKTTSYHKKKNPSSDADKDDSIIAPEKKPTPKSRVNRPKEQAAKSKSASGENGSTKSTPTKPAKKTNNQGAKSKGKSKIPKDFHLVEIKQKPEQILKKVNALKKTMGKNEAEITLSELGLDHVREVSEMENINVARNIEDIILEVTQTILSGKGFSYDVPTRSSGNQLYIPELDRIVLQDKISQRSFINTSHVRKTAITTRVMQLIHQVVSKGIHITKRDMFYTDVKLFKDQGESDNVLDDVACMVGCTRSCLNVVASDKGLVVGRVQFREDGDLIDCTKMGVGGKAIPPYVDKITDIVSDAKFIMLVEKEAAYMRLAEDRFYNTYPCIVITAKGQPDVATRLFLKKLKRTLNIPVFGLVDSDPYGLKILSVYMSGSKNMSYDSASLTTPDIKWLGIRPSDLDKYKLPEQCRLDMTEHDMKTGKELLNEDFIKKNPAWYKELELMLKMKKKAEIQALSAFGFQYITHHYLPQKLRDADWL